MLHFGLWRVLEKWPPNSQHRTSAQAQDPAPASLPNSKPPKQKSENPAQMI